MTKFFHINHAIFSNKDLSVQIAHQQGHVPGKWWHYAVLKHVAFLLFLTPLQLYTSF